MHCKFCGERIENDAVFCGYCGKDLRVNNSANSTVQPKESTNDIAKKRVVRKRKKTDSIKTAWGIFWRLTLFLVSFILIFFIIGNYISEKVKGNSEIKPGENNEMLYGAWVGETENHRFQYFEFNKDGTGYETTVYLNEDSNKYYYDGKAPIERMLEWSYTDGYGLEYLKSDGVKYEANLSKARGAFAKLNSKDLFTLTLQSGRTYYFYRVSKESLLSSADKAKAE